MKRQAAVLSALFLLLPAAAPGNWDFPPPKPVEEYGNLLIHRTSEKNNVKSVSFSHWMHRRKHTCRVCHFELEFNMKTNTTEITEEANRSGRYCGACHDGRTLFGHTEPHCGKCHNGDIGYGNLRFNDMWRYPVTKYGNRIDWSAALEEKWVSPARYLTTPPLPDEVNERKLDLDTAWINVPPSLFPHRKHTAWLDCNDCHPNIFNIKKKTTRIEMVKILKGEYCGLCHGSVAFPLTDCKRCHPTMRTPPKYPEPQSR